MNTKRIDWGDNIKERIINNKISLIPYYENYDEAIKWYQDYDVCKQVDDIDYLYDRDMLKRMYDHLTNNGLCYYIKYEDTLIGDVTLTNSDEVCIVISKQYQNMGIGKKVIKEIVKLAKEKEHKKIKANIYNFNKQSQKAFEALEFEAYKDEWYELNIDNNIAIQDTHGDRS